MVPLLCPTREQATGLQVVVGPILGPLTEQLAELENATGLSLELQPGGPTTAGESTFSISVLVEFNQDAAIECTLSEVFTHEVQTHTIEMKAGEPRAFRLGGLGGERLPTAPQLLQLAAGKWNTRALLRTAIVAKHRLEHHRDDLNWHDCVFRQQCQ